MSELLHVMRAIGENPTEEDVLKLMLEADTDGSGTIEFPEFLELMKQKYGNMDIEDDIRYLILVGFNNFDIVVHTGFTIFRESPYLCCHLV